MTNEWVCDCCKTLQSGFPAKTINLCPGCKEEDFNDKQRIEFLENYLQGEKWADASLEFLRPKDGNGDNAEKYFGEGVSLRQVIDFELMLLRVGNQ